MAIADNKVVTFKDLYGANSMASFSDVTPIQIEHPFFRGRVIPATQYASNTAKYYSQDQYNKRLKYVYYGYAFYGDSLTNSNIFDVRYTVYKPKYVTSGGSTSFNIIVPIFHTNDCTAYTQFGEPIGSDIIMSSILVGDIHGAALLKYSAISSLADEDMVNDIWMEYKPIVKTDSSTGEPMKDENGNLLYETDEEGNVLYEEGDYYAETRRADEGILPL